MINPNWIFVGLALQSWGGISYLFDTIKGKVQPNKVSWLLWSIAPLIAFFAQIKQGVGIEAWSTFIVGFIPLVVFCASFVNKKAKWEIGKLDIVCGILSILGLMLWLITKVGNVAIFFSILADGLAAIPTIVKSYKDPDSESHLPYSLGIPNSIFALLVITDWNFQNWGFVVYLLFVNTIIAVLVKFRLGKIINKYIKSS